MCEPYIDQAAASLSAAFADDKGTMSVAMPQLAEELAQLFGLVRQLQNEVERAQLRIHEQDTTISKLHESIAQSKSALVVHNQRLDKLEGNDGVVTHPQLAAVVRQLADAESLKSVKDTVTTLQQRTDKMADVTELRVISDLIDKNKEGVESLTKRITEEARGIRAQHAAFENETNENFRKAASGISKAVAQTSQLQSDVENALRAATDKKKTELDALREEASRNLTTCVDEIVTHIKAHAALLDELKKEKDERARTMPSRDELVSMRVEMDGIKRDMDRAQFRIHEAYSQCIAIAKFTGNNTSTEQQQQHAPLHQSRFSRGGATPVGGSSSTPHHPSASDSGLPTSVEVQVELLKRDVNKIGTVVLPNALDSVATLREQVDSVAEAQLRAQGLLSNLFLCLGIGDRGDEFCSALHAADRDRVTIVLRKCLHAISSAANSNLLAADISGNGTRSAAAFDASTQRRSDATAVVPKSIRLGLDVVDAFDATGKSERCAQIVSVEEGSVSSRCGLRPRDRVVEINGTKVDGAQSFVYALRVAEAVLRTASAANQRTGTFDDKLFFELIVMSPHGELRTVHMPFS